MQSSTYLSGPVSVADTAQKGSGNKRGDGREQKKAKRPREKHLIGPHHPVAILRIYAEYNH